MQPSAYEPSVEVITIVLNVKAKARVIIGEQK
jgi:hypothetical protein